MQEISYKEKRRNRRLKRIRSLILFLLILVLVFGWKQLFSFIKPIFGLGRAHLEHISSVSFAGMDTNGSESVYLINDQLCILEKERVTVYNKNGEFLSEKKTNAEKSVIRENGKTILIADLLLGEYIVFDKEGIVLKEENDLGKLDDIWLTSDEKVICLNEGRKDIQIIDSSEEEKTFIKVPSGKIIDISYSEPDQSMAVIVLDSSKTPYESNIFKYSLSGDLEGVTNFNDTIIYSAEYFVDGILVIADKSLALVDSMAEINWNNEVEGIINKFAFNSKQVVLNTILVEENLLDTEKSNKIQLYSWSGDFLSSFDVDVDIEGINAEHNQYIITFGKDELLLYDKKGEVLLRKTMKSPIRKVEWISKNRLVIIYNNEIEIFDLVY